jgi:phage shock protein A
MAIMMAKLYDALRAGNVPDDKARAAAEEAAAYENRAARIDTDLTVLKWMVATNLAMTIAILFKTFL